MRVTVKKNAGSGFLVLLMGVLIVEGFCAALPVRKPGEFWQDGSIFSRKSQDTTYIRQYATDKPQVLVIYSGNGTRTLAENLATAIMNRDEYKGKPADHVRLLGLDEAENMVFTPDAHRVFLISGSELTNDISDKLQTSIPGWKRANATSALIESDLMSAPDQKSGLTFQTLLYAPDPENLSRLLTNFMTRKYDRWNHMAGSELYRVNHVISFSDEESTVAVADWGSRHEARILKISGGSSGSTSGDLGDDLLKPTLDSTTELEFREWHPFGDQKKLLPVQIRGAPLAFFINRALQKTDLPATILARAYDKDFGDSTTLVGKQTLSDGTQVATFTAPNRGILEGLSVVYPNIDKIAGNATANEVQDRSDVKQAGLSLQSTLLDSATLSGIRECVLASIRRNLPDLITEDSKSAPYELQARVTQYDRSTNAIATKIPLFKRMSAIFDTAKPARDDFGKGKKGGDAYNDARQQWETDRATHEEHYRKDRCPWHLEVDRQESVKVSVDLRLVDQNKAGGVPLWEEQVASSFRGRPEIAEQEDVVITGHEQEPKGYHVPAHTNTCSPEFGTAAVIEALSTAFGHLQASCRLPGKPRVVEVGTPKEAYVVQVKDNTVDIELFPGDRQKLNPDSDRKPISPMVAKIFRIDYLLGEARKVPIGYLPVSLVFERSAQCVADPVTDSGLLSKIGEMLAKSPVDYPVVEFVPASSVPTTKRKGQ